MLADFLEDVRSRVTTKWSIGTAPEFIKTKTFLRGKPYSFKDHEFQEVILADTAVEVNTQKCSQIGMSEATSRYGVALVNMIPDFTVITTFPFSGDAASFARTRVDPFVSSSPYLREAVNPKMNSGEIKQFGENGFLYYRGTNGRTQALSIPADMIISDEIDRSDPATLSQYTSRLTHSPYKMRRNFSTPTIPKYGIALKMETSMRKHNLCKCDHCATWFKPDYFEHVKIPGYDGPLRAINTKGMLAKVRYLEAKLLCPHCGVEPDLAPEHREYVVENTQDKFEANGYYVSPFDAPRIITPSYLVFCGTEYVRYSEFENQNLGITSEDATDALTLGHLNRAFCAQGVNLASSSVHAMGVDMGLICYITVGRLSNEGQFLIVHRERCVLGSLEVRMKALKREHRVIITVMDSQPYVSEVQRYQKTDKNLYGAVYSNSKKLESFEIKMFDGDESAGKLPIHTVQVNREKALDMLLGAFQADEVLISPISEEEDELFQKHLLDMRRVQIFDEYQEMTWTWVKSKLAQDHYHHSTLYLWIAAHLRGTAGRMVPLAMSAMISKFKTRTQVE